VVHRPNRKLVHGNSLHVQILISNSFIMHLKNPLTTNDALLQYTTIKLSTGETFLLLDSFSVHMSTSVLTKYFLFVACFLKVFSNNAAMHKMSHVTGELMRINIWRVTC
jgi:hypothetical protein